MLSNCGMMDMGVFKFHHPSNPMIIKPTGWNTFFFCWPPKNWAWAVAAACLMKNSNKQEFQDLLLLLLLVAACIWWSGCLHAAGTFGACCNLEICSWCGIADPCLDTLLRDRSSGIARSGVLQLRLWVDFQLLRDWIFPFLRHEGIREDEDHLSIYLSIYLED